MKLLPAVLGDLEPGERAGAIAAASDALDAGGLVVLPTETVYGVFARADLPEALERLRRALSPDADDGAPFVWHPPITEIAREHLDLPAPVSRRLLTALTPGPVNFRVEQAADRLGSARAALGVGEGVIDDGHRLRVRVPDHPVARRVLECAEGTPVAIALSAATFAGEGAGRACVVAEGAGESSSDDIRPAAILDGGPTPIGRSSTTVTLALDGGFEVAPGGAVDEDRVMAALERTVLFVCTGNTCRSPMAEGIARDVVASGAFKGVTTRVESAGVAAAPGVPASEQAVVAMRERGIDISAHGSRPLTPAMIRDAEIVLTMTPSHAQAAMTLAPDMAHKIFPLDPRGVIEDPIGRPLEVYARTADRLRELIEQRLKELDA